MIELSKLRDERDKYKSYFYLSLIGAYVFITIMYFMFLDVHKLEESYKQSQNDLATATVKILEQKVLLSEVEELLRIREDLQKVLP